MIVQQPALYGKVLMPERWERNMSQGPVATRWDLFDALFMGNQRKERIK